MVVTEIMFHMVHEFNLCIFTESKNSNKLIQYKQNIIKFVISQIKDQNLVYTNIGVLVKATTMV